MSDPELISEEWLAGQYDRLCARAAAVPLKRRSKFMAEQIELLPITRVLKLALQNMMAVNEVTTKELMARNERLAGFAFGVGFVVVLLLLAVRFPNPTPFQFFVFRVVLSLAAAGIGGVLSGFLRIAFGNVEKPWLQAGGALAVFVLVYSLNPAKLVDVIGK